LHALEREGGCRVARARRRENITIVKMSSPSTTPPSDGSEKAIKIQQGSGSGAHRTSTTEPHAGAAKAASGAASRPVGLSGRTRNGLAPARPKLQIPESHGGSVTQVSAPTSSTQVRTTPPAVKNPTPTARTPTAATRTPRPSAPATTPAIASSSAAATPSRGPNSRDPRTASQVQPPATNRTLAAASSARDGTPRQRTTSAAASATPKQQLG
jgi:hypothetical protein